MQTEAATAGVENQRLVREFLESWKGLEPQRVLAYAADDIVYHDMPFQARGGKADFERRLKWFLGFFNECELSVRHMASADDGIVLCERVDRFRVDDTWLAFNVASVAVIRDGKIAEWREYYDAESAEREMSRGLGEPFRIDLRDE